MTTPTSSEPYVQRPRRSFASGSRWTTQRWSLPPTISVPPHAPAPPRSGSFSASEAPQSSGVLQQSSAISLPPSLPNLSLPSESIALGSFSAQSGSIAEPSVRFALTEKDSAISDSHRPVWMREHECGITTDDDDEGGSLRRESECGDDGYEDDVSRLAGCWAGDILAGGSARCSDEVNVCVVEGGVDGACYTHEFRDGDSLCAFLEGIIDGHADSIVDRAIFIPMGPDVPFAPQGWSLAIDADALALLWQVFELPGLLAAMVFEQRAGYGAWHDYFRADGVDIFYRFKHGINSQNTFMFSRTDLRARSSLTVCINPDPDAQRLAAAALHQRSLLRRRLQSLSHPRPSSRLPHDFSTHSVFLHAAIDEADAELDESRATLDDLEATPLEHLVLADVHALARQTSVLCAHLTELASHSTRVASLIPAVQESGRSYKSINPDEALLRSVRERCDGALRWLENYAHRAHNLLSIAGNAPQKRRGSAVTVSGRRWSGSVRDTEEAHWKEGTGAEGMVVVVFLPATFVCTLFSMAFFHFDPASPSMGERFLVSRRVWAFFVVLGLVGIAVAAACWAGRRWRRREILALKSEFGV